MTVAMRSSTGFVGLLTGAGLPSGANYNANASGIIAAVANQDVGAMQALGFSVNALAPSAVTALNQTTGSIPAGILVAAQETFIITSNATPGAQLVRTAAQMLADVPGILLGQGLTFRIVNTGAGTLTLTADAGATVTLSGTMTVATNTFRDFVITFNSATTATIQSVGVGTNN